MFPNNTVLHQLLVCSEPGCGTSQGLGNLSWPFVHNATAQAVSLCSPRACLSDLVAFFQAFSTDIPTKGSAYFINSATFFSTNQNQIISDAHCILCCESNLHSHSALWSFCHQSNLFSLLSCKRAALQRPCGMLRTQLAEASPGLNFLGSCQGSPGLSISAASKGTHSKQTGRGDCPAAASGGYEGP